MKNITYLGIKDGHLEFELECPVCKNKFNFYTHSYNISYDSISCHNCGVTMKLNNSRIVDRKKDGTFFSLKKEEKKLNGI